MGAENHPKQTEVPGAAASGDGQAAQAIIDPARMSDLAASLEQDGMQDVIGTYLEDTPGILDEINAASQVADLDAVQRLAHSLKSSSGIFGAQAMVAGCRAIELRAQRGQAPSAQDVQALQAAFQNLRTVLNSYMTNP